MKICSTVLFQSPWRCGNFSSPSSDHPQLIHIYENMLCKETPSSHWNFAIFLPVILVYKFHLLIILKYFFCLYWCFINYPSSEICIFLPAILVYNSHILRILQYFFWYWQWDVTFLFAMMYLSPCLLFWGVSRFPVFLSNPCFLRQNTWFLRQ